MAAPSRERELISTFVDLADTLVAGYDVIDLLHMLVTRCAHLFDAADAGILLADADLDLDVVASTSERSHLIGLLQLDAHEGPCLEAYRSGRVVSVDDIAAIHAHWPRFAAAAGELGYQSMSAIPLRLREDVIGSLNLFSDRVGPLDGDGVAAAQGLADIATIGILHERALRESHIVQDGLQHALDSRVVIEQAKGVLSHLEDVDVDEAFRLLRERARESGRPLSDVARETVEQAQRR